jgi:hypothetical protein
MYTEEMIKQRHNLRSSALVIENIRNWWRWDFVKRLI